MFSIKETDLIADLMSETGVYTEKYQQHKTLRPVNSQFTFVSIYPRIKGLKILFRIFINLAFSITTIKIRKNIRKNQILNQSRSRLKKKIDRKRNK